MSRELNYCSRFYRVIYDICHNYGVDFSKVENLEYVLSGCDEFVGYVNTNIDTFEGNSYYGFKSIIDIITTIRKTVVTSGDINETCDNIINLKSDILTRLLNDNRLKTYETLEEAEYERSLNPKDVLSIVNLMDLFDDYGTGVNSNQKYIDIMYQYNSGIRHRYINHNISYEKLRELLSRVRSVMRTWNMKLEVDYPDLHTDNIEIVLRYTDDIVLKNLINEIFE